MTKVMPELKKAYEAKVEKKLQAQLKKAKWSRWFYGFTEFRCWHRKKISKHEMCRMYLLCAIKYFVNMTISGLGKDRSDLRGQRRFFQSRCVDARFEALVHALTRSGRRDRPRGRPIVVEPQRVEDRRGNFHVDLFKTSAIGGQTLTFNRHRFVVRRRRRVLLPPLTLKRATGHARRV